MKEGGRQTMIENIKGVRNPLTIIAIFAGLAEISGTGILPFIAEANQSTYIWFLMIFPVVLVVLFFLTLNFNPKVLYSPSDFRDEANYMRIFEPSSAAQKLLKIQEEVVEESEAEKPLLLERHTETQPKVISSQAEIAELMKKDPRMRYQLAESLVIDRLTRELRIQPQRDLSLRNRSSMVMFDAVFQRPDGITVVEVKFFSGQIHLSRSRQTIQRIQASLQALPQNVQQNARLILAVAYDMPEERAEKAKRELESIASDSVIPIEVRMFSLPDLLKELEIK
jgi:hypothetical protein